MLQNTYVAHLTRFLLPITALGVSANTVAHDLQSQILSFEGKGIPEYVQASAAELSQTRSIHGEQSLLWHWGASPTLSVNHTFKRMTDKEASRAYGRGATQVLSFWIYNPQAVEDSMALTLSDKDGQEISELNVNMNFTGWRTIGVSLNKDFSEVVTSSFEKLVFTAPASVNHDAAPIYIDRIMVSVDDKRYQWSDDQVTTRYVLPEIDFDLPVHLEMPSDVEVKGAAQLRQNLTAQFMGRPGSFASLQQRFNAYQIEKSQDNVITGRHIVTGYQKTIYQPKHLLVQDRAAFDEYRQLADYTKLMWDLAKAYHHPIYDAHKTELANMYRLMTAHLIDQGYADGSSLVTTHHWGYGARWWYISALMMADTLQSDALLKPTYRALLWFSREFKSSFDMELNDESSDLDYFNTLSNQHLALILLNPDVKERIALLKKFTAFFSAALSQTPSGYHDGFRPDGTAWRHRGHYPGYAFHAFKRAAQVAKVLKDTPFSLNIEALDSLKAVMVAGWRYTNPFVPMALSGRHPFSKLGIMHYQGGLRDLAMAYPTLDEELAAIYLQVSQTPEAQSQSVFGQTITPAKLPEGSWSFNGGAFVVHRHGERMAMIKGYNKDVWSSEIYYKDNRYGRYQSHGSVHVMPYGDPEAFGYQQAGWDWSRNPGTTTIHLDYDALESPNKHSLTLRSEQGISGATSLHDKFSLFTFKHQAPENLAKFDASFVAEKHVMAADDMLFLAGNGISNKDGQNRTETTLFQLAVKDINRPVWINGKRYVGEAFSVTLSSGDWLIDENGVGYFLQQAESVHVSRTMQSSRHNKTKAATQGLFTTAWIDHGVAPLDAHYEYVMVMDTTPEQMQVLAKKMARYPYFNTRKTDQNGMYIRNRVNNLYGYSSTGVTHFKYGPVRTVSTTAQLLLQLNGDSASLSVASPELKLDKNGPTQSVPIEVVVKGTWTTEDTHYTHHKGDTIIHATSFFGQPMAVSLSKVQ
ncbi:chondroitin lyase [Pseudoalteromonas rubra]|uniref:Chondroitin sulfate ABC lyase n=2 Tax=Pseudoalteromonas TaxID=53246 RepID=A0A5S3V2Q8_9GAMM|nr:chondroitinase family polysaccharide lyase [Pseudoalteromonas rubra]QPB85849.1 chondroitin lyase [Pseudoalteromonas rubra]